MGVGVFLCRTLLRSVVVVVINTNTAGSSKRPTLCAGSSAEVAACVAAHGGPAVDAGVSAPDAAVPPTDAAEALDSGAEPVDAGVSAADAGTTAPPLPEESSCASVRGSTPSLLLVATLLGLSALRRRRR
jgi:hypothetical protein